MIKSDTNGQTIHVEPKLLTLEGYAIKVEQRMVGAKRALLCRGTIHVSPAMYALMNGASDRDLKFLLDHLQVVKLDTPR